MQHFSRRRLACVLAGVLAIGVGAGGCGDGDAATTTPHTSTAAAGPPNLVGIEQVHSEQEGSAERALLSWWRAVQFRDADVAQGLATQQSMQRIGGAAVLRDAVRVVGDRLPNLKLTDRASTGRDRVSLRGFVVYYDARGEEASRSPLSFSMRRVEGTWKVDDLSYIRKVARALEAAADKAEREADAG